MDTDSYQQVTRSSRVAGAGPRERASAPLPPRAHPLTLHRPGAVRGALVRTREPLAQKVRRFNWCAAIKRHQRGRHAGESDDVRAPAVLFDSGDLDDIWTSPDGFFEAMNGCGHSDAEGLFETRAILRFERNETSEAPYEGAPQFQSSKMSRASVRKEIVLSIHPQEMHGPYTGFAQVELLDLAIRQRHDWRLHPDGVRALGILRES
jgi:hypothetical protein